MRRAEPAVERPQAEVDGQQRGGVGRAASRVRGADALRHCDDRGDAVAVARRSQADDNDPREVRC